MRPELVVLALALASQGGAAGDRPAAPAELAELTRQLRAVETLTADFVETKTMGLLAEPLVTEGVLAYRDPGELARVIEAPRPGRVLVTEDAVVTVRDDRVERLDLGARPEARSLVTALLSLLRGDLQTLRERFRARYETREGGRWRLILEPRSKRVAALVERLELEGRGPALARYVVREASGDVAVTEVTHVRVGRPPEEVARWFEIP
jgi:outer membrane lipoprotein-sorting protein